MAPFARWAERINDAVARSVVGKHFRLEGSSHPRPIFSSRFLTEVQAGITTFFTLSYVIAVNATVLADSGGPCVCNDPVDTLCKTNIEYASCLTEVHRDIITATAAIACLASCVFGLLTNLPVAIAPGMGLNAYFAYHVVGFHGSGHVPYRLALTAVFIEGFIFLFLSLLGMRQWLVRVLPASIKIASGCGIGLFLSLIGLSYGAGIGAVTGAVTTPLDLGGCPEQYRDPYTGVCTSHKMQSPKMWIGIMLGGVLTAYLMSYKIKSAITIGIMLVAFTAWPRDTSFTMFPRTPQGDSNFEYFKQVVSFRPLKYTLNALQWDLTGIGGEFGLALITFLYVDIIDCTGTLYSMARFSGVINPSTGDFPRSTVAYCIDALSISVGALLGTSPSTAMIESGAGIAEGGKTGITAISTGLCFFVTLFFGPIFASIPPWASGCTLVLVGCMMARQITMINWRYIGDAVPAFVTMLVMPFSYSIAYGLIAGIGVYIVLNSLLYITKIVSRERILPVDEDHREYWTIRPPGSAPWFIRAAQDPRGFFSNPLSPEDRPDFDPSGHTEIKTFGGVMTKKGGTLRGHHNRPCLKCGPTNHCSCRRSRSSTGSSSGTPGPSSSFGNPNLNRSNTVLDSFDRAEAREAMRRKEALDRQRSMSRQHMGNGFAASETIAGGHYWPREDRPERERSRGVGIGIANGSGIGIGIGTTRGHSASPPAYATNPTSPVGTVVPTTASSTMTSAITTAVAGSGNSTASSTTPLGDLYDRFPMPQMPSQAHLPGQHRD